MNAAPSKKESLRYNANSKKLGRDREQPQRCISRMWGMYVRSLLLWRNNQSEHRVVA